MVEAKLDAPLM